WRRSSDTEASKNDSAAAFAFAMLPSADTITTGCGNASSTASDVPEGRMGIGCGRFMPPVSIQDASEPAYAPAPIRTLHSRRTHHRLERDIVGPRSAPRQ